MGWETLQTFANPNAKRPKWKEHRQWSATQCESDAGAEASDANGGPSVATGMVGLFSLSITVIGSKSINNNDNHDYWQ
jgi:hypothetical protein